ncbi:hypothetical protein EIL87_06155 [Saccharopolyspora rhizosphaerae]|uniref:DUF6292 domain-containing protein n=1 Tax=Saccharopolyspora rhizosphaerae TaxID=2492662 RepID=A0A426JZU0_9PSEU|nr:DUF6292 family protein [Saccharopolyspora rhizosphaerae]RRO18694.1 hypothetical protein EIL87_06155 [Saccharopolyspora rhizosphaerae]
MDMKVSVVSGLVNYVRSVTEGLDDEVGTVDLDVESGLATVIVVLNSRVPTLAELPLLLTWDEVSGWALRVAVDGEGETTPVAYLDEDVLPEPVRVQLFLRAATSGDNPGSLFAPAFRLPNAPDDLESRLEKFPELEH